VKTQCPNCNASDKIPAQSSSQNINCWRCGEWYTIKEGKGILLQKHELISHTYHSRDDKMSDQSSILKGIYGWLVIPAIGLVLAPLMSLFGLITGIGMVQTHASELLSDARLWLSGLIDVFMITATIIVAILFFTMRRITVQAVICLLIASVIANSAQAFLNVNMFDKVETDTYMPIVHSIVYASIWIPYFMMSKRVKNTFVN
jgi:hypothetical protein